MITIYDAPEHMIRNREWLESAREKNLHFVSPAIKGKRQGHAYEVLQDIMSLHEYGMYCDRVNRAVDIGSLCPLRFVSLLPVPPNPKTPDWYRIFTDMFRVHFMMDQSFTILVLLDAGIYTDTAFIHKELIRAGQDYPEPRDRKIPFVYFHAED